MNQEEKKALQKVLEYLHEEKKDFEAYTEKPSEHIYSSIQILEKYLTQNPQL